MGKALTSRPATSAECHQQFRWPAGICFASGPYACGDDGGGAMPNCESPHPVAHQSKSALYARGQFRASLTASLAFSPACFTFAEA